MTNVYFTDEKLNSDDISKNRNWRQHSIIGPSFNFMLNLEGPPFSLIIPGRYIISYDFKNKLITRRRNKNLGPFSF